VIPQNLEDLKKELGVQSLLGSPGALQMLLKWSQELAREKGPNYLRENRHLLLAQWEHIWNDLI
jgi:hypothetical protein